LAWPLRSHAVRPCKASHGGFRQARINSNKKGFIFNNGLHFTLQSWQNHFAWCDAEFSLFEKYKLKLL